MVLGLSREFPDDGIVSEERPVSEEACRRLRVWYVDPLDDRLYVGIRDEIAWVIRGGQRRRTWVSVAAPPHALRLAVSRSHRHQTIDCIKAWFGTTVTEVLCGSVGAKIGLLLSGQADAYVEPSPYTSKWDVCGAEAILRGAGGFMSDMAGGPMEYEGPDIRNRRGFVATNRACHDAVLAAISASGAEIREQ